MKKESIAVFCGMDNRVFPKLKNPAFILGSLIAQSQYNLITAGAKVGLVNSVINGYASHKYLDGLYGVMPKLFKKLKIEHTLVPKANFTWTDNIMGTLIFRDRCDYAVFLPGGFGTLNELSSFLIYSQLELMPKPIILINIDGFWTPVLEQFQCMVDKNLLQKKELECLHITTCVEECINLITSWKSKHRR